MNTNLKELGKMMKDLGYLFFLSVILINSIPEPTVQQKGAVLICVIAVGLGILLENKGD